MDYSQCFNRCQPSNNPVPTQNALGRQSRILLTLTASTCDIAAPEGFNLLEVWPRETTVAGDCDTHGQDQVRFALHADVFVATQRSTRSKQGSF